MIPLTPTYMIDDLELYKLSAKNKAHQLLSLIDNKSKLVKTACSENSKDALISLFANMLNCLKLIANEKDISTIVENFAKESIESTIKTASITKSERKDDIKIVSKSIKDSHYQIDLSKDVIQKDNKRVYMVSCYARDAYLGRYHIKRNYFYTINREKAADEAYDEIKTKVAAIKDRYYNEVIEPPAIFAQIKQVLDGVIPEIKSEEDSIATNINRHN
jgi:hypothetical protein